MKVHHLLLVSFIAPTSIAQSNTYWVHSSCQNPKFNGGFDFGIKDALFMARRSLMRLNAPVSPYMDDIFLLLFRKPRTDIATLNKVKNIFETIGERFVPTTNQVAAEVRFYCDNDEYGDGKRWTLTPNDPDDPIYVRNDQLPRLPPPGKKVEDQPLQQWQDETNWIRQSRGSMGCADPGTQAETYTSKFSSERSPSGMNANRATITICDSSLLLSELVTPEFLKYSSFRGLDNDFASRLPFAEFTTYGKQVVSLDILHELTHIDKDGFRTDDVTYEWEEIVTQSAEKAIRNAETFVLYAMFSRAAEKGYRLRMDGADDAAKLQMINRAEIFYDQHLERVGGEQDTPF